jgi:hypothetical protein
LSSNSFIVRNLAVFKNLALSKLAYFSLIESYIRYSTVLWGRSSKTNSNRIFVLQKLIVIGLNLENPDEIRSEVDEYYAKFISLPYDSSNVQ